MLGFPLAAGIVIVAAALFFRPKGAGEDKAPNDTKHAPSTSLPAESPTAAARATEPPSPVPPKNFGKPQPEGIRLDLPPSDESEKALLVSKLYGNASTKERVEAINRLFAQLHKPGFESVLQGFIHAAQNDPEVDVRKHALYYLVREPHVEAFDAAMRSLLEDRAEDVRLSILQHLDKLATRPEAYDVFILKYMSTLSAGNPSLNVDKASSEMVRQRRKQFLQVLEKVSASPDDGVGGTNMVVRLKEALTHPW